MENKRIVEETTGRVQINTCGKAIPLCRPSIALCCVALKEGQVMQAFAQLPTADGNSTCRIGIGRDVSSQLGRLASSLKV